METDDAQWQPGTSTPHRHADGRPKESPDETSMFGLNAVWSELNRGEETPSRRRSRHSSQGRRVVWPVAALICGALLAAGVMLWALTTM